jgi:putative tryptophan/tyrosine transport system substrate-binding protein
LKRTARLTIPRLVSVLAAVVLVMPLTPRAQPPSKIWRVGWLQPSPSPSPGHASFRQAMGELGYLEGRNVKFEDRFADGHFDRLPALAADLARSNVDVIVAVAPGAIRAAREATRTVPIVMAFSGVDPVKAQFVTSLNRPGGNVTGITMLAPELSAKRLDLLKQALPNATRVGVLGYRANPGTAEQLRAIESVADALGVTLHVVLTERPGTYIEAFARLARERVAAVLVLSDTVLATDRRQIVETATKHRLPVFLDFRESAEVGGLLSYGVNNLDLYRQAARFVDRILKGAKPADLPVEQPTKFELVINLKAAKALGLTIPMTLAARADHVIE